MTSRGLKETDFVKVCDFIDKAVNIGLGAMKKTGKLSPISHFHVWVMT